MSEITFKIEYINMNDQEFEEYITSLNGVIETRINSAQDEVYIKYDSKLININRLVLETKLFLNLANAPSIVRFDKHSKKNLAKTSITIEDACCEYCTKGTIEDLILIKGIEIANADFDYDNYFNISIEIEYDKNIFIENDIKDLVLKAFHY